MPLVRRRPLAGLAAAIGAAAIIAGCGGGSDAPSADEFREQADAVCTDADARTDALERPDTNDEILPFLEAGLTIQGEQITRIRALDAPDDLQATFDEATALLQERQDLIQGAVDRIAGGEDPEAVVAEIDPEVERLRDEARAKAGELGLAVCGSGDDEDGGTSTTGTTGTETAPPGSSTAGAGEATQYVTDVQEAATALQGFGNILQGTTSLDDLRDRVPDAQAQLDEFDAAIAELNGYTLDDPTLEQQREGLSETGPRVTEVLRRFVDAASSGDTEAVQALVPEVGQAIQDFQEAATASTTP